MFGSHPLESDGINPNLFFILAKENKKELRSCSIDIPPTILFEQGFAKAVFQTESSAGLGEVKRKAGRDYDLDEIFHMMTRHTQEGDVCAVLMYASPRTVELNNVRFMDRVELQKFLFVEIEKPKGLLQRFVRPKGNTNSLIHVVWSPLMVLTEGRRCQHSLTDRHLPVQMRAATFEDPKAPTVEIVVSQAIVDKITRACKTIAEHFDKTEKLQLNRLGCYFKVDETNRLQFLCSTSMRFVDNVTGTNNAPVSLGLGVRTPLKVKDAAAKAEPDLGKLNGTLSEMDATSRTLSITIPSLPDTAALLLKGIHHHSPTRRTTSPVRSPSPSQRRGRASPASPPRASRMPAVSRSSLSNRRSPGLKSPASTPGRAIGGPACPDNGAAQPHPGASRSGVALPPPGGEAKVVYIGKTTPVPQPAQLLRFQHMLPNSNLNVDISKKLLAAGRTETEIQQGWEQFLAEQERSIALIQAQAAREKHEKQRAAQSERIAAAMEKLEDMAVPPVRIHSTFEEQHPGVRRDEVIGGGGAQGTNGEGGAAAAPAAAGNTHAEMVRLKEERQRGAADDKAVYMSVVRQAMAKKALEEGRAASCSSSNRAVAFGVSTAGAAASGDGVDDAEDDPMLRVDRAAPRVHLPAVSSISRSMLLPPPLVRAQALGAHPTPAAAGGGGKAPLLEGSSPVFTAGGMRQRSPSPERTRGSRASRTRALASSPARGKSGPGGSKAATTAEKAVERAAEVAAASPGAVKVSISTPRGGGSHTSDAGAATAQPLTPSPRRSAWKASIGDALDASDTRTHFVERLQQRRCKVPRGRYPTDFSGLSSDDVAALHTAAHALCEEFRLYVRELVYAVYSFLIESAGSKAYIELPGKFAPCVTPPQLGHILRRLHPVVVPRVEFLLDNVPSRHGGDLVGFRNELLSRLHSGSLREWPFQPLQPPPSDSAVERELRTSATSGPSRVSPISPILHSPLSEPASTIAGGDAQGSDFANNASLAASGGGGGGGAMTRLPSSLSSPLDGHVHHRDFAAKCRTAAALGAEECVVVPLLEARGYDILRYEVAGVDAEVEPFVSEPDGAIFRATLRHLYLLRLAEIQGEQEAAERRRELEAEERTAAEEVERDASAGHDGQESGARSSSPALAATASSHSVSALGSPSHSRTRLEASLAGEEDDAASSDGASRTPKVHQAASFAAEVCTRCNTCKICCVCRLVFSSKKLLLQKQNRR